MKLYIKQHFLTLFGCDSFDVFDENGDTVYTVQGEFSIGKCLNIYDASEQFLGTVKRRLLTWLPQFEIYLGEEYLGVIQKEFSLFTPSFSIDYLGWSVEGDFFEWDYTISAMSGEPVAVVSKEPFHFTDTYCIDVRHRDFALHALMLVLAIDAEKASRN